MVTNFSVQQVFLFILNVAFAKSTELDAISALVKQWAPLIWMSPGEKFMPSSVEHFLNNVFVSEDGINPIHSQQHFFPKENSHKMFLVTKENLDILKLNSSSYLYGMNPKENAVPIYAVVNQCSPYKSWHSSDPNNIRNDINVMLGKEETNLYFHVSYWVFYPYNEGKEICFIGKVPTPKFFGRCLGYLKTMGNHVGDWEHASLSFQGRPVPNEMFLAVHDAGVYYKYNPQKNVFQYFSQVTRKGIVQNPKFPPTVRMVGGHPVLFSSFGSHGLWSAPGEHIYVRVPRLKDRNGYGVPWKTWNNLNIFHMSISILPDWMQYKGKWGNPKSNCLLFNKLGICENSDGPTGILMKRLDFYCWKVN